jgi:hypothetical protein
MSLTAGVRQRIAYRGNDGRVGLVESPTRQVSYCFCCGVGDVAAGTGTTVDQNPIIISSKV